jgi:hypothetical protein
LALAREPHVDELTHSLQYLNHYRAALTDATDENPESDALAGFAKLLLISNEFLYVD